MPAVQPTLLPPVDENSTSTSVQKQMEFTVDASKMNAMPEESSKERPTQTEYTYSPFEPKDNESKTKGENSTGEKNEADRKTEAGEDSKPCKMEYFCERVFSVRRVKIDPKYEPTLNQIAKFLNKHITSKAVAPEEELIDRFYFSTRWDWWDPNSGKQVDETLVENEIIGDSYYRFQFPTEALPKLYSSIRFLHDHDIPMVMLGKQAKKYFLFFDLDIYCKKKKIPGLTVDHMGNTIYDFGPGKCGIIGACADLNDTPHSGLGKEITKIMNNLAGQLFDEDLLFQTLAKALGEVTVEGKQRYIREYMNSRKGESPPPEGSSYDEEQLGSDYLMKHPELDLYIYRSHGMKLTTNRMGKKPPKSKNAYLFSGLGGGPGNSDALRGSNAVKEEESDDDDEYCVEGADAKFSYHVVVPQLLMERANMCVKPKPKHGKFTSADIKAYLQENCCKGECLEGNKENSVEGNLISLLPDHSKIQLYVKDTFRWTNEDDKTNRLTVLRNDLRRLMDNEVLNCEEHKNPPYEDPIFSNDWSEVFDDHPIYHERMPAPTGLRLPYTIRQPKLPAPVLENESTLLAGSIFGHPEEIVDEATLDQEPLGSDSDEIVDCFGEKEERERQTANRLKVEKELILQTIKGQQKKLLGFYANRENMRSKLPYKKVRYSIEHNAIADNGASADEDDPEHYSIVAACLLDQEKGPSKKSLTQGSNQRADDGSSSELVWNMIGDVQCPVDRMDANRIAPSKLRLVGKPFGPSRPNGVYEMEQELSKISSYPIAFPVWFREDHIEDFRNCWCRVCEDQEDEDSKPINHLKYYYCRTNLWRNI